MSEKETIREEVGGATPAEGLSMKGQPDIMVNSQGRCMISLPHGNLVFEFQLAGKNWQDVGWAFFRAGEVWAKRCAIKDLQDDEQSTVQELEDSLREDSEAF